MKSIGQKLLSGFLSIGLLLIIVSGFSLYEIEKVNNSYSDLVDRRMVILSNTKDIQFNAARQVAGLRGILIGEQGAADTLQDAIDAIQTKVEETSPLIRRAEIKKMATQISEINKEYEKVSEQVVAAAAANPTEAKRIASDTLVPMSREISTLADKLTQEQAKVMQEGSAQNKALVKRVILTVILVSAASVVLAAIIGLWISRNISKPVLALVAAARRIAQGDLTGERVNVKNKDELGELTESFEVMKKNIRDLVHVVQGNTRRVASTSSDLSASSEQTGKASEQIATSMQEVAIGTERQVADTAKAMQESINMVGRMDEAAEAVAKVADLTEEANHTTAEGRRVVTNAIEHMDKVRSASAQIAGSVVSLEQKATEIGGIIDIIKEIASQTNLLALNASIEAARAGEQGRGFAVVAGEIRKLAEQSNAAAGQIRSRIEEVQHVTKETTEAIHESGSIISGGISLFEEAGQSFALISTAVATIASEAEGVSLVTDQARVSAKSMAGTLEGIALIAEQAAANTQNVAAAAEEQTASMQEVTASAETLSTMAEELEEVIQTFKV
ncbi:methyl-accepting chemotaxis protein [Paenibacillus aurantiacus]|uniref:Methyl-accepting chemotaxis protein n=1 Tax=Paenibacillus aurantiacus TaxID=1936118 RepID=A0ABV5KZV2_9BACL